MRVLRNASWLLACFSVLGVPLLLQAEPRPAKPAEIAAKVDAALMEGLSTSAPLPAAVNDETFLRRITIDLTGKLPAPDVIHRFVADTAVDKRAKVIQELLQSEAYAVNWGRYWRDTLTYHTPASSNYLRWKLFDDWWT